MEEEAGLPRVSHRILAFSYSVKAQERQNYRPLFQAAYTEAGETEHVVFGGCSFVKVGAKAALLHGSLL